MMDSDSPNVLHPRVWALSDRRKRPPGASWAFQMLQKASHLPHGFTTWQNRAPYGSKSCPGLSMVSSFQKCCCGRSQMQVLAPQGPASVLDDGHFTSSLPHSRMNDMSGCSTLPLPAHHALPSLMPWRVQQAPELHWPRRSACSKCCTGAKDHHVRHALLLHS